MESVIYGKKHTLYFPRVKTQRNVVLCYGNTTDIYLTFNSWLTNWRRLRWMDEPECEELLSNHDTLNGDKNAGFRLTLA